MDRELPPYVYGRECGPNERVLPLEQVLAIQKQAYEDGLRDAGKDAERYRWLRSRKSLELSSSSGEWTRIDGSKFTASHYLSEGGTQHGAAPSLDETIDSAMLVAMLKAKEQP